ncbi:MAG: hypothetical protein IPH46_07705 [Bacteroidetes bacterium]|nr:hypothetical protein [Bacteroidota bacterium]
MQEISVKELDKVANELIAFWSWLSSFQANGAINKPNTIPSGDTARASNAIKEIINNHRDALSNLIPETFTYSVERVYIPILRGLRPTQLKDDENFDEIQDNYLKRTVRDYFKDAEIKDDEIFTGLRLYNDTKKMLLGKQVERDKIRRFEAFLSKTFFNDQPFTLIPNIEDDSLHVSIGNEERPIYNWAMVFNL